MNALKIAAGVISLLDSLFGVYVAFTGTFSSVYVGLPVLLFWVSIVLLVASIPCIYGVHYAFPVAALLSAILAADSPMALSGSLLHEVGLVALSLIAIAMDILAFRTASTMPEQGNPMNLPVFG
jgi:hypothetical protein